MSTDKKIVKFTDLLAWQEGHTLVIMVYASTKTFPSEEKFSLTSQVRRAALSVTSNIAEGFGRQAKKDKLHFYVMARGSLFELQNQLLAARDIDILQAASYSKLSDQVTQTQKLLHGLIKSVRSNG